MKKIIKTILVLSFVITCFYNYTKDAYATDFSGRESEMLKMCKRTDLSKSERATCTEFKAYINEKNDSLTDDMSVAKANVNETKEQVEVVAKQIKEAENEITLKNEEIEFLNVDIKNTEQEIETKENILKDRMYEMQTYTNSNQFIDFILGASDFSDLFSRIEGVSEITSADKQLISELNDSKAQLEADKVSLEESKTILEEAKNSLAAKKAELDQLVVKYQSDWETMKALQEANEDSMAEMDAALQASQVREDELNSAKDDLNNGSTSGGQTIPGNAAGAVQAALSKLGSPYVWGATGSNSFDCSGLTQWAYRQAGITIGRTTWDQINNGRSVSTSELIPGDLIFFHTMSGTPPTHVGMYIGDGKFVHAPNARSVVRVDYFSGYWAQKYYAARRIVS